MIDPDRSKGYKTKMIELPRYLQVGKPPQSKNTEFLGNLQSFIFNLNVKIKLTIIILIS